MRLASNILMSLVLLLLPGCANRGTADESVRQIRTIEQEHLPESRASDQAADSSTAELAEDAVPLPFAPPISMDPVDGSKVSIRRDTPSIEYEGKVYHFSSEENMKLFVQSPKKYLAGSLATY